ncbi:DNA-processing protein DprA [Salinimonas chungwhensis]|uniref:DNA-processing protein DprA n=1 Tax=Salinimonas chungwhensis TaxID=265425 RepID=UPI000362F074|nr:DNA-processing protein DprA [Salinimonas chungwhensis]
MSASGCSRDLAALLALASAQGVGPATWLNLLSTLKISPSELVGGNWSPMTAAQQDQINTLLGRIDQSKIDAAHDWQKSDPTHHLIGYTDAHYPAMLRHLSSPPLVLFVKGELECLTVPFMALVGSRRASPNGLSLARYIAAQLSQAGLGIISGMAAGIDAAAHQGALDVSGPTVAVIGTGADQIYPRRNRSLHQNIIARGGAIISEFWPGTPPRPRHFPQRNRIIAAMALGTLVIEATIKSGTLITANMAANMGRDVFAIPGNIDNPLTAGCHHLLKQGAILVTGVNDILDELQLPEQKISNTEDLKTASQQKTHEESLATDKLLASVNHDVTGVDIICERSNMPVSQVLATLLQYELRGLVAAVPGGYIKLRGK